jgi:hypothetical protein
MGQAIQQPDQRQAIIGKIAGTDPGAAMQAQQHFATQDATQKKANQDKLAQLSKIMHNSPDLAPQVFPEWRAALAAELGPGVTIPDKYDPGVLDAAKAFTAAGDPYTLSAGAKRFDSSNRLVAEAPFSPPDKKLVDVPDGKGGTRQMEYSNGVFSVPNYGGPAPSAAPAPAGAQGATLNPPQDFAQLVSSFGAKPTSLFRDPEHNRQVGGVANSQHTAGTAGDFAIPPQQRAAFIAQARQMGYEAIDEGDHVHVELPRGASASGRFGAGQSVGGGLGYTPPKSESGQFATLSADEVRSLGLPVGTVAQRSPTGQVQIVNKPRDLPAGGQVIDNGDGTTTYIPAGKTSEGERNAAGFYQRMLSANEQMGALTGKGYDPTNIKDFYSAGGEFTNWAASSEGQQYRQAQENWVRANLRKESGAAIGKDEMVQERKNYFPTPGDSPGTIKQKAEQRKVVEQAMRTAAGGAIPPASKATGKYRVGQIIDHGGKKFRVTGGDMNDPDVEAVR